MDIREMTKLAREVANAYDTHNQRQGRLRWNIDNYMAGFVGDVGDLSKLIMAKSGHRCRSNLEASLTHEISDCLWSILILADELGIDLDVAFRENMATLLRRLKVPD